MTSDTPLTEPPPRPIARWPAELATAVLLLAAVLIAYAPALHGQFLWNDSDYVTSPELRSLHGLWRIWFEVNATEQYYPVLHSAFWVEHRLWGNSPWGYHLANVVPHAFSAFLVVLLVRRLRLPGAIFAGFLFALHPVCVESVAWIAEQKNTLSTVFCLLAALAYLRWDEARDGAKPPGLGRYIGASLLFLLALLSKSVTASLPGVLVILAWWQRGKLTWKRDGFPLVPWLAGGAAVGLFTGWVEWKYVGATGSQFTLSFLQRCLIAGRAAWFYLGKLLWPSHLVFFYPRWHVDPTALWQYLYPAGAAAVLIILWRARLRGALAAALVFLVSLFPVLGFLNVYAFVFSFVADHWQYLASLGVLVPLAAALAALAERGNERVRRLAQTGALVLCAGLGLLTRHQTAMYQSDLVLYETTLKSNPSSSMVHHNLGNVLEAEGKPDEAMAHYKEAIRLEPDYPDAENDWGIALADLGKTDEAITHYRTALRLRPKFPQALNNLGAALLAEGRIEEARTNLAEALKLTPRFGSALNNLGMTLASAGDWAGAIPNYQRALEIQPDSADAHNNLGVALASLHRYSEAKVEYERAIAISPGFVEAHSNLGNLLLNLGRASDAIAEYQKAIALNGRYVQARFNLGIALASLGQKEDAAEQFKECLRLDPNFGLARQQLTRLGLAQGQAP